MPSWAIMSIASPGAKWTEEQMMLVVKKQKNTYGEPYK